MDLVTYIHMLIVGVIQGIFEWLPVSSKTIVMMYSYIVLGKSIEASYALGLIVQGGAVLAAIAYFRRELLKLLLLRDREVLMFLIISTTTTGFSGVLLYITYRHVLTAMSTYIDIIMIAIGLALLLQATLWRLLKPGLKTMSNISILDSILFGIIQGLAVTPGLSRSGITVALLLYLGYTLEDSLKLSFLASIPVNFGATILTLTMEGVNIAYPNANLLPITLLTSTIVSFTTIKFLINTARRHGYKLTTLLGLLTLAIGITTALL